MLSRSAAAGTQQAVPRSEGAQALTRRSGAVQRSGGAPQRAPSGRRSAQQAIRHPAGTQELHSAQGARSGAQGASRWCSAQGALRDAQGRSGVDQGRSGAHQALRGCVVLSRGLAGGTGAVQCSGGAQALSWRSRATRQAGGIQAPRGRAVLGGPGAQQAPRGFPALRGLSGAKQALSGRSVGAQALIKHPGAVQRPAGAQPQALNRR